jgi:hypothetical protein
MVLVLVLFVEYYLLLKSNDSPVLEIAYEPIISSIRFEMDYLRDSVAVLCGIIYEDEER